MQSGTVRVRNLNLFYRTLGAGPDVLLLHGWASSSGMWRSTMQALAGRFRLWALDLHGFGDSDKPNGGCYSVPNYTASVRDFAESVGIRQARIVGHSMGGMIALDLAAAHAGLVRRLVLVNPVVSGQIRMPLPALSNHRRVRRPLVLLARRALPMVMDWAVRYPATAWLSARSLLRSRRDFFRATPDSILGCLRAMLDYDTTPMLPRISSPTLVIVGDRDPVVSPDEGCLAAERIPGARLEVFRAGHQLYDERPAQFQAALRSFLDTPD